MLASLVPALCVPAPGFAEEKNRSGVQMWHSAVRGTASGLYTYVPGKWSLLSVEATNRSSTAQEVLTTSFFDGEQALQYGRRLWLPAGSKLRSWYPVLVPAHIEPERNQIGINSLVLDPDAPSEVLVRENTGEFVHTALLPIFRGAPVTGLIDSLVPPPDPRASSPAYDLVVATRVGNRLNRATSQLNERLFAPDDTALEALHQLVIADSRVLDDLTGLAAVRRWLHAGGRLWVMLDRVDPLALELILGDANNCQVVDRVGLTTVRIESPSRVGPPEIIENEYEEPVDLVRTIVTGVDVFCTIDGWPAAFGRPFGNGQLLVTTLGPRGWMRARTDRDEQSQAFASQSNWVPLAPMLEMSREFYSTRLPDASAAQVLEEHVGEYVGYTIPSRELIVGLLAGLGMLVVGGGLWLLKKQALEHLGWLGPALSLCVAGAVLGIGAANRHEIPALAASLDLVQAIPGNDDVRTEGSVALYTPEAARSEISATRGGRLVPDMQGLEGSVRRMVWTDFDAWHWEHLTLRPGPRLAKFSESSERPERIEARGVFGPEGLTGRVSGGGATGLGDALLATRTGRIGVTLSPDGTFSAPADAVLGPGQYLHSGLVASDEQVRRQRVYEQVLKMLTSGSGADEPLLCVWSDPWDTGFRFDENRRRLGASLAVVPLTFERPPAGTLVRIPPPLLPFRNAKQPDGTTPSSTLFDYRKQEGLDRLEPGSLWMKFRLPRELLPIELTRALLLVDVTGPVGRLEVLGLIPEGQGPRGRAVSIETIRDPVGRLKFEIGDLELLRVGPDGTLVLGISGGDPERPELTHPPDQDGKPSYWKIERLSLELWGRTTE